METNELTEKYAKELEIDTQVDATNLLEKQYSAPNMGINGSIDAHKLNSTSYVYLMPKTLYYTRKCKEMYYQLVFLL